MKVEMPVGIKNKFTFHVDDIVTGEHREYAAYNIVLNSMWSRLVNFQPFFMNIHFGTGTGAFNDPARTSLYTHLGTKAATTEFQTRALPTSQWRRKIVLNPEEYVGAEITEIGVAYGSGTANLVTHASPKDSEGNPITIGPKKDTEIVTIYADMYFVLAENMYGGKIKWVTPLANNELLTYLMGGSYPTQQFRVTKVPNFDREGTAPYSHGQSTDILVANWIKDVTSKKVTTPAPALTVRLGTTVGNGEIKGFGLGSSDINGIFRGQLPVPNALTNVGITETLGDGDGVKQGFSPTWSFANISSARMDGVVVDASDYNLKPTRNGTNIFHLRKVQTLVNTTNLKPDNLVDGVAGNPSSGFDVGTEIGIDVGEQAGIVPVDTFRIFGANTVNTNIQIRGSNNIDFSDSVLLGSITSIVYLQWAEVAFSPVTYRYYRIVSASGGASNFSIYEIELIPSSHQITFTTPPPAGAVITADYTVDYIPKDEFHVLDLQAGIQYGEVI